MTCAPITASDLRALEDRVRGEFLEMPGERLTVEQASRLWDIDEKAVATLLDRLVNAGFLRCVGPYYFRADLGHLSA